jgi:hypothetical protein
MNERRRNWNIWSGFLLCIFGFLSYPLLFARFPSTRDVPWANFLLLGAGLVLLISGIRRAFGQSQQYRGKIVGPILGVIGLAAAGFFCFLIFYASKQLPKSAGAPRIGQKAPEFVLRDTSNKEVSLASLMAMPLSSSQAAPKGVLLVFYRGYW